MTLTIGEITQLINAVNIIEELEDHRCFLDEWKGVQNAIARRKRAPEKEQALREKYVEVAYFENEILEEHPSAIIRGIDEVGKGPSADPVVACATVSNSDHNYLGPGDSKRIPVTKRLELNEALENGATAFVYGVATVEEIDEFGIYKATQIAMQRVIDGLSIQPTHLLVDAMMLGDACFLYISSSLRDIYLMKR